MSVPQRWRKGGQTPGGFFELLSKGENSRRYAVLAKLSSRHGGSMNVIDTEEQDFEDQKYAERLKQLAGDFYVEHSALREVKTLGHGGFAVVKLATWEHDGKETKVAVKALLESASSSDEDDAAKNEDIKEFVRESYVLRNLNHPNVVRFLGIGCQHEGTIREMRNSLYLLQEYCSQGTLKMKMAAQITKRPQRKREYTQETACGWLRDVAAGLAYLHCQSPKVVHRDLKPENVLLEEHPDGPHLPEICKITDFGLHRCIKGADAPGSTHANSSVGASPQGSRHGSVHGGVKGLNHIVVSSHGSRIAEHPDDGDKAERDTPEPITPPAVRVPTALGVMPASSPHGASPLGGGGTPHGASPRGSMRSPRRLAMGAQTPLETGLRALQEDRSLRSGNTNVKDDETAPETEKPVITLSPRHSLDRPYISASPRDSYVDDVMEQDTARVMACVNVETNRPVENASCNSGIRATTPIGTPEKPPPTLVKGLRSGLRKSIGRSRAGAPYRLSKRYVFSVRQQATGKVGSLMYMAPEVWLGQAHDEAVDTFAFGVLAFELFTGKLMQILVAMRADTLKIELEDAYKQHINNVARGVREPIPSTCPKEVGALIEACWAQDPEKRPTMLHIVEKLDELCEQGVFQAWDKEISEAMNAASTGAGGCCCTIQ